jgi:hypothetical protein
MDARLLGIAVVTVVLVTCNGKVAFDPNGCDRDDECQLPSLHCDADTGSCVACMTDAHCAADVDAGSLQLATCDPSLHRCVECATDVDCASGKLCRGHRCVTACRNEGGDPACAGSSASHCEAQLGYCIECEDDNRACAAGSLVGTLCNHQIGRCVACISDANCGGTNPHCDPIQGRCVVCLTSADCGSDRPLCDPTTLDCTTRP